MKQSNILCPQRQISESYTRILNDQIRGNAQRRASSQIDNTGCPANVFPFSLGYEQMKVARYVTQQLGGEAVLRNEETLNRFRLEAIMYRNSRNRKVDSKTPMMSESMMPGYAKTYLPVIQENYSLSQPIANNIQSISNRIQPISHSIQNNYSLHQPSKHIKTQSNQEDVFSTLKLNKKKKKKYIKYVKSKNQGNLNVLEYLLKDINTKIKHNSFILEKGLASIKETKQQNEIMLKTKKSYDMISSKDTEKLYKIFNPKKRFYTISHQENNLPHKYKNPTVEYSASANYIDILQKAKQGLTLLKLNKVSNKYNIFRNED